MKTITLKLTPDNNRNIEECLEGSEYSELSAQLHHNNLSPRDVGITFCDSTLVGGGFTCDVLDVKRFKEYLVGILKHKDSLLYSILSKLDKAVVQNDEPKSFKTEEELVKYFRSIGDKNYNDASDQYILDEAWENGEWEEDDKGGYRLVQNDEPKGDLGVWDITFYREDDEGNQTLYKYNGDCSVFSDMVDEDDLTEVQNDEPKIDKNLLNEMHKNDFRDKLIELGEDGYVEWVEKVAYKNLK